MSLATLTSTGNVADLEGHRGPGQERQGDVPQGDPLSRDHVSTGYISNPPHIRSWRAQPPRVPQVGSDRRAGILPPLWDQLTPCYLLRTLRPQSRRSTGSRHPTCQRAPCLSTGAVGRGPPKLVTPARIALGYIGAVAAVKRLAEGLQTLDGVAVGGKQTMLIMSNYGIDLGFENWPWGATQ
ncbi:hypothetical protein FIBSPDRAFT_76212 [Athelia psychrophila]|uniref:Uncharacterized protein n=1 Tax=Athelia psychrophila TaxID=1759441 RepID=A0A166EF70_9AGAM|nr:hypothetical protein FIBSPDRAFT_76212 [Fibularhizoctonia sp. CBS 109695]